MAAVANGIDFLTSLLEGSTSNVGCQSGVQTTINALYAAFGFMWLVVWGIYSEGDFSVIMTAGTTLQALGWLILTVEVKARRSVEGLSSQCLVLFLFFYILRLTATCLKNGYIPVDSSGDYMLQGFDFVSMFCVIHLIYVMHKDFVHSYQDEHDTLDIKKMVVTAAILGYFIHGDFNKNDFFDSVWATSLNIETLTMVPQLFMMAKVGGAVNNGTSHWVFCIVASCVCRSTFWYWAYAEQVTLSAGYHILICHVLQLFLCGDFMFYYVQSCINGSGEVVLPQSDGMAI